MTDTWVSLPSASIGSMDPDPLTPAALAAQARRCGLVTQRELAAGVVEVIGPLGRCQVGDGGGTYAVTTGRRPVGYVKVAAGHPGRLERERAVLTALAERDCAAEIVEGPREDQLWTAVAGSRSVADVRGSMNDVLDLCQAWGAALGRLHTTPVRVSRTGGGRPPRARPWVLDRRTLVRTLAGEGPGPATDRRHWILACLEESVELRLAAAEVAERWTAEHWVHGDLRLAQVMVSEHGGPRVRFVGLGYGGLGDPAWDLAAAYDGLTAQAVVWGLPTTLTVEYFLQGYRHAGGPARLYPAMQAVHALAAAWQDAEADTASGAVTGWVAQGRVHAARTHGGWLTAA